MTQTKSPPKESLDILEGKIEFEVVDEKNKMKTVCKFVKWSHNNKRAILRDVNTNKNISVDGKSFLEYIGFFN